MTEIDIGCAGGIDVTASANYTLTSTSSNFVKIEIKGLQGGHSGMDIHKGFGNSNVISEDCFMQEFQTKFN